MMSEQVTKITCDKTKKKCRPEQELKKITNNDKKQQTVKQKNVMRTKRTRNRQTKIKEQMR